MSAAPAIAAPDTLRGCVEAAAGRLAEAGVDNPRLDARVLVCAALEVGPEELVARPERPVDARKRAVIDGFVGRRAGGEPVSRILGWREFWSLGFSVTPATLDPRPDSETLVEAVLEAFPDRARPLRVVDLGTGTGCLLLAVLSEFPNATGVGVDIDPDTVAAAAANATRLGLASRVEFRCDDWGRTLDERFDCLLSNPPYIPTGEMADLPREVRHDPELALNGGIDGLDSVRAVMRAAARLLKPGGRGFVEVGLGQGEHAGAIASDLGMAFRGTRSDLAGIGRVVEISR